jgi:acylphosphatase
MGDERVSVHLRISGRVQGVYFRASTAEEARRIGLTGWVRNLSDGSVEAHAEGSRERIDELVRWCRTGPPAAVVSDVEADFGEAQGQFSGFNVRY